MYCTSMYYWHLLPATGTYYQHTRGVRTILVTQDGDTVSLAVPRCLDTINSGPFFVACEHFKLEYEDSRLTELLNEAITALLLHCTHYY